MSELMRLRREEESLSRQIEMREIETLKQEHETLSREVERLSRKERNTSLATLMSMKATDMELKNAGADSSPINPQHTSAKLKESKIDLNINIDESLIKSVNTASQLMGHFVDGEELLDKLVLRDFHYRTEADIGILVRCAVEDAVALLRKEGVFEDDKDCIRVSNECSLFGCRPDILVIKHNKISLLSIENKKPSPRSLIEYPRLRGHVYDQAQALAAFEQGIGLALLTSFKESFLCSLTKERFILEPEKQSVMDTDSSVTLGHNPSFSQPPPAVTKPKLQCTTVPTNGLAQIQASQVDSPANSSTTSSTKAPDIVEEESSVYQLEVVEPHASTFHKENANTRFLFSSKLYPRNELVHLVYHAVKLALRHSNYHPKVLHELEEAKAYHFRKVLRAGSTKNEYSWGQLILKLGRPVQSLSTKGTCNEKTKDGWYYLVGILGRGSTSTVFHAITQEGCQVALKMFVQNFVDNQALTEEEFKLRAKEYTSKEASKLKLLYPDLKAYFKTVTVNNFHCVEMPIFTPIPLSDREDAITQIREVLEDVFWKNAVQYEEEDIRWRHVGMLGDRIILFDVASLKDIDENTVPNSRKSFSGHHVDILWGRFEVGCLTCSD